MGFVQDLEDRILGGSDDQLDIQALTLEELEEEKMGLRADVKLKRDKHKDLSKKREKMFEKIVDAEDELLKKELAEEIASIEDEMAILYNEHRNLMDALRVVDGIIALKRKEKMAEREGIIAKIRNMDKEDLVEKLRRSDVREMIRQEKWDELDSLMDGQLQPRDVESDRVDEIISQAEEVKSIEDEMGMQDAIEHALKKRDTDRAKEEMEV